MRWNRAEGVLGKGRRRAWPGRAGAGDRKFKRAFYARERPVRFGVYAAIDIQKGNTGRPRGGRGCTLLVTGGFGSIGSNFMAAHLAQRPHDRVIVLDALTYAGRVTYW